MPINNATARHEQTAVVCANPIASRYAQRHNDRQGFPFEGTDAHSNAACLSDDPALGSDGLADDLLRGVPALHPSQAQAATNAPPAAATAPPAATPGDSTARPASAQALAALAADFDKTPAVIVARVGGTPITLGMVADRVRGWHPHGETRLRGRHSMWR